MRLALAYLRHWAQSIGYLIRPYDMTLDARRWRWQRAGICGSRFFYEMSPEQQAALVQAIERTRDKR